jgi:hypothetical protein
MAPFAFVSCRSHVGRFDSLAVVLLERLSAIVNRVAAGLPFPEVGAISESSRSVLVRLRRLLDTLRFGTGEIAAEGRYLI